MTKYESFLETVVARWCRHDADCKRRTENWTDMEMQRAIAAPGAAYNGPACTCGLDAALAQIRQTDTTESPKPDQP